MARRLRPALEIVSDIGSLGFDLQHHDEQEIADAVALLRTVNPEMFTWLSQLLSGGRPPTTEKRRRCMTVTTKPDPQFFTEHGEYLDGPHYGKDCPVGKVQVEFIGIDPSLRFSPYGYKPSDHAFLDVWVDGRRYNIQIGTFESSKGNRRGLHIVTDGIGLHVDKHSMNALDVYFDAPPDSGDVRDPRPSEP